jgi:glutamate dehydrogenase (NAD(P)+)
MAWMMDTYSMNVGATATGVVTGKPDGTSAARWAAWKATGRGVFVTGCEAARASTSSSTAPSVAVQGFGNVGSAAAELFGQAGAKIVAVQDHTGTIYNAKGFDVAKVITACRAALAACRRWPGADVISGDDAFWNVESATC